MILIGRGFLYIHIVSTKVISIIVLLLLHCVIFNHPVMGLIFETPLSIEISFLFLCIFYEPNKSTQILFPVILSTILAENSPYFILNFLLHCHESHFLDYFWMVSILLVKNKCYKIIFYCESITIQKIYV